MFRKGYTKGRITLMNLQGFVREYDFVFIEGFELADQAKTLGLQTVEINLAMVTEKTYLGTKPLRVIFKLKEKQGFF